MNKATNLIILFTLPGITNTLFFFFNFLTETLTTSSGVIQLKYRLFLNSFVFIPALLWKLDLTNPGQSTWNLIPLSLRLICNDSVKAILNNLVAGYIA